MAPSQQKPVIDRLSAQNFLPSADLDSGAHSLKNKQLEREIG
jgi:hypothetical protein